jgi:hypothetical protein
MTSVLTVLFSLFVTQCQASVDQNRLEVNPIRKIVGMLQDMQKELEHEADSEEELFEKAMCTCESGEKSLSSVIDESAAETDRLTSKIEEDTAESDSLAEELKNHAETKKSAENDLAKATGLREKEMDDFSKMKKSQTFSIESIGKAIPQLSGASSASAFMQDAYSEAPKLRRVVELTHYLTPNNREKVLSFLDDGLGEGQGEPSAGVAEIVGILKSMSDEMIKDLDESTKAEEQAALGFGELKDAKEQEIKVSGEAIVAKEKRTGGLRMSLVMDKNSLDDAKDENADATKYLANLKEQCATKMKERDTRKKMRTDEIAAISEAVKILSDDDALDVFKKAVPSASLLAEKKSKVDYDAFMQVRTSSSAGAKRFAKARSLISKMEKKHPSAQMKLLLLTVSQQEKAMEDPAAKSATEENFDGAAKVVDGMIDNMVHVLHDDDVEDEHKKDWCANETEVSTNLQTEKQALVEKLKADLESMGDALDQTNEEIKVLEETIAALDKSVHDATEQRKKEHGEFVNAFATMDTARRLIDKAATRLEKFYNPKAHAAKVEAVKKKALDDAGLGLVQRATPEPSLAVRRLTANFDALIQRHSSTAKKVDPIEIMDTPKTYEKKESGGVIGLMMEMKSDLTADMTEAEMEEKFSAKDYARIMKDAQETRAADVKSLNHKKSMKAELEGKIVDAKTLQETTLEELQNLALYLVQLNSECSFLLRNFEVRHESRVGEEVGLEDAKTIVTHETPPDHKTVEGGFASEHSPKQVDEHFEGGHHPGEGTSTLDH